MPEIPLSEVPVEQLVLMNRFSGWYHAAIPASPDVCRAVRGDPSGSFWVRTACYYEVLPCLPLYLRKCERPACQCRFRQR